MKPPLPSEHASQAAVIDWWRVACRTYRLPEFALYAIPNAAKRSFALARYMQAEGMRKGIPDLFLAVSRGGFHGLFLEMKRKPNKVEEDQRELIAYLRAAGYLVDVCWSAQDAIDTIKWYLG